MSRKLYLAHTGTPQRFDFDPKGSGRYRQGSGENPHQHEVDFLAKVKQMRKSGRYKSDTEIAKALGFTSTEFRAKVTLEGKKRDAIEAGKVKYMRYKRQMSNIAIAKELGISDHKVARYLSDCEKVRDRKINNTEQVLKDALKKNKWIDVGTGTESLLGVPKTTLKATLKKITEEGDYELIKVYVNQINSERNQTTTMILCPKGTSVHDILTHLDQVKPLVEYNSKDLGESFEYMEKPAPVSSKRIAFTYADKTGYQPKDGMIELRPGVEDLDLDGSRYAQVRINVDDKYYLKGMAYYNPDLPKGVDIRFNSNKQEGTPMEKVLKPMETTNGKPDGPIDWTNPFGANLKADGRGQHYYIGKDGKKHLSAINKIQEEGDWGEWSRNLAAQMLSKQPLELAKNQLNLTYLDKLAEFEKIQSVPNTTLRKHLLYSFADDCDASAEELKAAAMPRQATQVLLALENIDEKEIFAPNFRTGEHVALVRYPHSGPFEIVNLKVNNKNPEAIKLFGTNPKDCVIINPKNLPKLSGADCDGDNVVVIPNKWNSKTKSFTIKVEDQLEDLKGFDGHIQYAASPGCPLIKTDSEKGLQMGKITNLIADMYLQQAPPDEMARAIKHQQVIIDAKKHKLDYKASERDNRILELKRKYQGGGNKGASTLITRAKSPVDIPIRSMSYKIDPETGKKIYAPSTKPTETKWKKDENGNWISYEKQRTETISKMASVDDAMQLAMNPNNPMPIEEAYGTFANAMKKMANDARKEGVSLKTEPVSPNAQKVYAKEVEELLMSNKRASAHSPYERQAQRAAKVIIDQKKLENPEMSEKEIAKKGQQALQACRNRCVPGGKKERVVITERQMEAINNNAINATTLKSIINNTDQETLLKVAIPKPKSGVALSPAQIAFAKAMLERGFVQSDVAEKFGVSPTTLMKYIK